MSGKSFKVLFNESINIFKENILSFLLLSLFIFVPVSLAHVYLGENILDDKMIEQFINNTEQYVDTTDYEKIALASAITKQLATYLVITFVIALFSIAGDIVVIKIVHDSTNKTKRSFLEVFEESLKQFPSVIWAFLISNFIIGLGLLLIFPGLFLYFLFSFTLQTTVILKLKGMKAIRYGAFVARKNLLRVVGYAVFVLAISIAISFATSLPINLISSESVRNAINVIKLSFDSLILCIPTILFTLLFIDMQRNVEEEINIVFKIDHPQGQS